MLERENKLAVPAGRRREMIETIRQGLKADGYAVSISAVPLVRLSSSHRVLQADKEAHYDTGAPCCADQADARGASLVRLLNRGLPAEIQQNHRTECFPADALAGTQAACWL
jgi:hypothetical protein